MLERWGLWLAEWSEKWFPDALVFALVGIVIVFAFGLAIGESPSKLAIEGGKSFWILIPFTMQMAMIIIGGFVVATSPPVYKLIQALAGIPKSPRGAIAYVAVFSMVSSLISWGFSLIFSGLLVRELSRRLEGMDYRAAGAAAYLGLGAVWALGLSSSAALMMATKGSIPPKLYEISGLIPLTQTLFTWANFWTMGILVVLSTAIAFFSAPSPERAKTAADFGLKFEPVDMSIEERKKPGEWLEYSPILTILTAALLAWYLVDVFQKSPTGALAALDLNTYNLIFITLGMLLHWRPKRFLRAVSQSVPATGGVLIQFPFYAVIFGMIAGTGITKWLAGLFVSITTQGTYPLLVALYSALLGIFIPSGGSKWVIEATYVLQAAVEHKVNLGWVVQIYNAAEAIPNLLNPFWMLPLLGMLHVKARDLVGYSALQMFIHIPVVFFLCWFFAQYIPYIPPVK
ncbi:MAG: short-chain fatty acid transporter [Nitrospiraceae bacterium]|nr:short-chain fatty acid transporter [Nitrospiraceae bacterium]